jgi:penicillin-binding protein 2
VAESCDVYFYQVGQRLGVDRLARYARMFGLGEKSGVEMEHEKPGLIPTAAWKKSKRGQAWQEGETLSIAIGQGYDLATPLQIAEMTAVIANGGTLYKPSVIEKVVDPDGRVTHSFTPEVLNRITGQGRNLKLVREGMVDAVNSRRGTGREAQIDAHGILVGGKTGTAQVVRLAVYKHLKEKDIPYEYRDHAWFTCFAPAVNPEIVVTVLVEHGLHGGSASAPIAAKILNRYFEDKMSEQQGKTDGEQPDAQLPAGRVVLDGQMIEEADAPQDDEDAANGEAGAPPAPQPDESVNGPL